MNQKQLQHHLYAIKENGHVIDRVISGGQIDLLLNTCRNQGDHDRVALFIDGVNREAGHLTNEQVQQIERKLKTARLAVSTYPRAA